jgi:hypothetical protein
MFVTLARQAWEAVLAVMPRTVLRRLDDWARRHAQARAERRRNLMRQRA